MYVYVSLKCTHFTTHFNEMGDRKTLISHGNSLVVDLLMEHGPIHGADEELEIVIYDIRTDGNISTLGEIFFVILSGEVDVNFTVIIRGQDDPVTILVTFLVILGSIHSERMRLHFAIVSFDVFRCSM